MRFQYTEKKVTLPENVHKYAEKKVMKLERFFGTDADALVTFSVEKNRNNVEITVHAANTYFRASESTSDMFASIDAAVATIERQIRKNKTRLARRLRQDAFVRTPDETSFAPEEPEEGTFELVRTQEVQHEADDPRGGHPPDEPAGAYVLRVPRPRTTTARLQSCTREPTAATA